MCFSYYRCDTVDQDQIRRAKWLKMNLTYNSKSLVVQVLRRQSLHNRTKGDVFSDMPNVHFDVLKDKLNDDKEWDFLRSLNLSNLTQLEISDL